MHPSDNKSDEFYIHSMKCLSQYFRLRLDIAALRVGSGSRGLSAKNSFIQGRPIDEKTVEVKI
jgi:hypothetical protein